ncbi:MAG TPA: phage tail protein [Solirubrobacteraceae bacterium]|jgi:phage tail-like protein|nr:phage tail protein [Solirubrobacteraceae bacterium]
MAAVEVGEALAASYFYVELTGLTTVAVREISGIGSENDVIVQHQVNAKGAAMYVKVPGKLSWNNIVLKKGIDTNMDLWSWRNLIVTKGADGNRKDGQIYVVDVTGAAKTTWKFINAWPCSYVVGAMVPDTNEMLLEEVHLAHEGLERVT